MVSEVRRSTLEPDPVADDSYPQHLVDLTSVEDDGLGEQLTVIWEIELDARVLLHETFPTPVGKGFDPPDRLAAFLDAVPWGAITSADSRALQAPFRSGIIIEDYQLDPVVRALSMPRVNLLVADDVGLGKTIEAGLVALEMILRHRARSVIVVCPASLCIKWQQEMASKFGLEFRIVDAELVRNLRRDRGLAANPWQHYPRLIVSIDWLKRPRPMSLFREVLHPDSRTYPRSGSLDVMGETPVFRKDIVQSIAHGTSELGLVAIHARDNELEQLAFRFLNSYLRSALNQRAPYFSYSLMNEYRRLAGEATRGRPEQLLPAIDHLLHYGRLFANAGMSFGLVIAAEDVADLTFEAARDGLECSLKAAARLLTTVHELVTTVDPAAARGVLVATLKLALRAVAERREALLEVLCVGIARLPDAVVTEALDAINRLEEALFWEVTDRVLSFDWVEPELRERIPNLVDLLRDARSRMRAEMESISRPG